MSHRLERQQRVPAALAEVFEFFADARNLELLTPPFLRFRVLTPAPIEMRAGALIEYRIHLAGVPMSWLTEISVWEPGQRFVDTQLKGPYRLWRHLHEFTAVDGGTEMRDVVDYELPFGPLGELVHSVAVKATLRRIFDFRAQVIAERFRGAER